MSLKLLLKTNNYKKLQINIRYNFKNNDIRIINVHFTILLTKHCYLWYQIYYIKYIFFYVLQEH